MNLVDLLSPGFLQFLTAFLAFVAAVITLIVVIIDSRRRQLGGQPGDSSSTNPGLPLHPPSGPSAIQAEETGPASKPGNENRTEYEAGYQTNKGGERLLQQKQHER